MNIELEDKLYELEMACNRYSETDPLADWVMFAIDRYITTGRATPAFVKAFISFPQDRMQELIATCLNGDRSDAGIMKAAKKIIMKVA